MPGYVRERFPELTSTDWDDYGCGLCHEIFNTPVTTTCCLQTYCDDCITEWLQTNTTCPYDKKPLTKQGLSKTPRAMLRAVGRFKIRCDYWDNGCLDVVKLENLTEHTVNCRYKVVKCSKCRLPHTSGHYCIKSLLTENDKLRTTNKVLANEIDLMGGGFWGRSAYSRATISDPEILVECRQHLSTPDVSHTCMSADMADKTLAIIRQQLTKQNSLYLVCKYVVEHMEKELGYEWNVRLICPAVVWTTIQMRWIAI